MALDLALFPFNNRSNTAASDEGWVSNTVVNARAGNDTIISTNTFNYGIENLRGGTINTGAGNDTITSTKRGNWGIINEGTINTGAGNDTITGNGLIANGGTINTGRGNDTITGIGFGLGIYNDGIIDTGSGNDIVDALQGGFAGSAGTTNLGSGIDILKGFGTGTFNGGAGRRDKLRFDEGTYVISGSTVVLFGMTMNVFEFEKIGGVNGRLFDFRDGTLTVNSDGVAAFTA